MMTARPSRGEGHSAPVSFQNVSKRFGNVVAVDGLDLDVPNGEMLVLLGPSGCGKTTSLRMLAGLESISDGTIRIGETVVNNLPPRARDIAMVFQSYALYAHLSVYENLAYPLRVRKLSKAEIDARVREVAQVVQPHPGQPHPRPQPREPVGAHVGTPRTAVGITEQECVVGQALTQREPPLPNAQPVRTQQRHRRLVDRQAPALMRLRVLLPQLVAHVRDRPADHHLAALEVDVDPAQRARLAPPATRRREHPQVHTEVGVLGVGSRDELLHLGDRRRHDLAPTLRRRCRIDGRVARDQAPAAGLLERLAGHGVADPHRPGRQAPRVQLGVEPVEIQHPALDPRPSTLNRRAAA